MTAELPCCEGLAQHTRDKDCLLHRTDAYDLDNEEDRKRLAKKIADEMMYDAGGFLQPGIRAIYLEPGERVLSQEDMRRLLGDEEGQ